MCMASSHSRSIDQVVISRLSLQLSQCTPLVEAQPLREVIAAAAKELDQLRCNWLNPSEWTKTEYLEFPGTVGGPWDRYIVRAVSKSPGADASGSGGSEIGTVRYPRVVPKDDASAAKLKKC